MQRKRLINILIDQGLLNDIEFGKSVRKIFLNYSAACFSDCKIWSFTTLIMRTRYRFSMMCIR
jgi:hypothetical protein